MKSAARGDSLCRIKRCLDALHLSSALLASSATDDFAMLRIGRKDSEERELQWVS
jgi:hypothetical protein